VEVRGKESALAAARAFADLQELDGNDAGCPCLLLLDNLQPAEISRIVAALRDEGLLESVLIEASGNIVQENIEEYAACGADALSVGALTHSARSLDICQRI
jgi:nicotinate-nucleotide pyrophosphorylase (carboxylating)